MPRISEQECFLEIAKTFSRRSTCKRRNYGAVIVKYPKWRKRGILISGGYNGSAATRPNCCDIPGDCHREKQNMTHNTDYTNCVSTHAETNACLQGGDRIDNTCVLYLYGFDLKTNTEVDCPTPCHLCTAALLNVGITKYVNNKGEHIIERKEIHSGGCG